MEQNMILASQDGKQLVFPKAGQMVENIGETVKKPLEWLRSYYSHVLERDLSLRQTLLLLHAQVALVFAAFPIDGPLLLRALCVAWLVKAVLMCRKAL